jgi:hypothetical protein
LIARLFSDVGLASAVAIDAGACYMCQVSEPIDAGVCDAHQHRFRGFSTIRSKKRTHAMDETFGDDPFGSGLLPWRAIADARYG